MSSMHKMVIDRKRRNGKDFGSSLSNYYTTKTKTVVEYIFLICMIVVLLKKSLFDSVNRIKWLFFNVCTIV